MKEISIIGTVGLPAKYGGWETLVDHLTKNLSDEYQITVFCSSKRYTERPVEINNVQLKYVGLDANGVQSIPYDIVSIWRSMRFADTILILGVSGCIFLPVVKFLRKDIKLVVNIDGLEWKRQKWGKAAKWFLRLSEKIAVKYADITVSDNKIIQDYIQEQYSVDSSLIPYGADHVDKLLITDVLLEQYNFLSASYAFTVCRIEPENNLHIILSAFKDIEQLNIVIVGNWNNSNYGVELKNKYSSYKNIYLLDPIYDQNILNQLRSNCFVYLHGHSAGGTNPSLVEAMYLELPIIAFDVNFNRITTKENALYFDDSRSLIDHLSSLNERSLNKISQDLKLVADQYYTWSVVSSKYKDIL